MKYKLSKISIIVFILLSCYYCDAQDKFHYDAVAEKYFTTGLKYFQNKRYEEAFNIFDSLMNQKTIHQRTTGSYMMAGKTLQKMKRFKASILILKDLLKLFPSSSYSSDALFTLAVDYLYLQKNYESAIALRDCIESGDDTSLSSKSEKLLNEITDKYLTADDLNNILKSTKAIRMVDFIHLKLAEKYYHIGKINDAQKLVKEVLQRDSSSYYTGLYQRLDFRLQTGKSIKIGVLLPFSKQTSGGSMQVISNELLDGIKFALSEYTIQNSTAPQALLDVRDTDRNLSVAVKEFRKLADDEDVISVIGSLGSDETMRIAEESARLSMPLFAPTATAVGIASKGKYVFQLNPDYEVRGRLLARYIVKKLKLKTIAILASGETVGKSSADAFRKEAEKLGAKIADIQYYAKGSTDLSEQFYNIRKSGLALQGSKKSEENLKIPITSIQGLFLAISDQEDIGVLASQINYFNIKTQLFGSNEWYAPGNLEANKRYLNGIIFITDSYFDENDSRYKSVENIFIHEMKKRPSRYSIIGYDACRLILNKISDGNITREAVVHSLQSGKQFQGIHRRISFTENRINDEMYIMQFINGEIEKLEDISFDELK
ncbi:MAG: penicillin-binding protein activator [Ignavibacteriales bacterium]|nr:penicillin-binding protein activator [Ignavibacteriales bacterium]